ncbi:unnamed protein product [Parajaminaea phylloscopi]
MRPATIAESPRSPPIEVSSCEESVATSRPANARRRRRRLSAPKSIVHYAQRKLYFSVTELVGPTWCEVSYQYGILGQSSLPLAERPLEVTLPSGQVIKPNTDLVQRKEVIQQKGRDVHRKLEEEIHPVQVYVHTTSEEDDWALRLLRLVVGLRSLLDTGCVRELPVFGWVQDHLVIGIIDEIERRPLRSPRQSDRVATHPIGDASQSNLLPDDGRFMSVAFSGPKDAESAIVRSPRDGKTWRSQEEWRAHQRKVEAAKKQLAKHDASRRRNKGNASDGAPGVDRPTTPSKPRTSSSPRKAPATPEAKQRSLVGFFTGHSQKGGVVRVDGPGAKADESVTEPHGARGKEYTDLPSTPKLISQPDVLPAEAPHSVSSRPEGFFLADTKTRAFPVIPAVGDQRAARLQTMLYKRLLDGLCLGACQRMDGMSNDATLDFQSNTPSGSSSLERDPGATPLHFPRLFERLQLDSSCALSDAFLSDSAVLLDGLDASDASSARRPQDETQPAGSNEQDRSAGLPKSLDDVVELVDRTLIELVHRARSAILPGAAQSPFPAATAIQTELSLVYRQQQRKEHWKRRRKAGASQSSMTTSAPAPAQSARHSRATVLPHREPTAGSDDEETRQLQLAIQMSLDGQAELTSACPVEIVDLDGDSMRGEAVVVASPSRRRRSRRLAAASTQSEHLTPHPAVAPDQVQSPDGSSNVRVGDQEVVDLTDEPPAPRTPDKKRSRTGAKGKAGQVSPRTRDTAGRLIGKVHFQSDPALLTSHLDSILLFYAGERAPRGVPESETWKCKGCEWQEGCEWRQAKGQERAEWALSRRRDQAPMPIVVDDGEEGQGADAGRAAYILPIVVDEKEQPPRGNVDGDVAVDDEAALWDHFEDPSLSADGVDGGIEQW